MTAIAYDYREKVKEIRLARLNEEGPNLGYVCFVYMQGDKKVKFSGLPKNAEWQEDYHWHTNRHAVGWLIRIRFGESSDKDLVEEIKFLVQCEKCEMPEEVKRVEFEFRH